MSGDGSDRFPRAQGVVGCAGAGAVVTAERASVNDAVVLGRGVFLLPPCPPPSASVNPAADGLGDLIRSGLVRFGLMPHPVKSYRRCQLGLSFLSPYGKAAVLPRARERGLPARAL